MGNVIETYGVVTLKIPKKRMQNTNASLFFLMNSIHGKERDIFFSFHSTKICTKTHSQGNPKRMQQYFSILMTIESFQFFNLPKTINLNKCK
jgi:hypothetical protein